MRNIVRQYCVMSIDQIRLATSVVCFTKLERQELQIDLIRVNVDLMIYLVLVAKYRDLVAQSAPLFSRIQHPHRFTPFLLLE